MRFTKVGNSDRNLPRFAVFPYLMIMYMTATAAANEIAKAMTIGMFGIQRPLALEG